MPTGVIVFIGIMVLLPAAWCAYKFYTWYGYTKPGTLSIEIVTGSGHVYSDIVHTKEAEGGLERFEYHDTSYRAPQKSKDPHYFAKVAMFVNVPHAYYVEGREEPIDLVGKGRKGITTEELDLLGWQHIVSDTLRELAKEIFNPLTLFLIGCGVTVVVGIAVYHFVSNDIHTLQKMLSVVAGGGPTYVPPTK